MLALGVLFFLILFAIAAAAALAYEVWPEVEDKLYGFRRPWREWNDKVRVKVLGATIEGLSQPRVLLAATPRGSRILRWIRNGSAPLPLRSGHGHALLAWGAVTAMRKRVVTTVPPELAAYFASVVDAEGKLKEPLQRVDQLMLATVLYDMHEVTGDAHYRKAAALLCDSALATLKRAPSGAFLWSQTSPPVILVDNLAMVCPAMMRHWRWTQRLDARDAALLQAKEFLALGVDRTSNLPFHGYWYEMGLPGGLVGWSRGCGWFLLGLVETLAFLDPSAEDYAPLHEAFLKALARLAELQSPEGDWAWLASPGNVRSAKDSSATAIIAYCAERAMELDLVPAARFAAMTGKAAQALAGYVQEDGVLTGALCECPGLGSHPQEYGPSAYVQGFALALASTIRGASRVE